MNHYGIGAMMVVNDADHDGLGYQDIYRMLSTMWFGFGLFQFSFVWDNNIIG